MEDDVASVVACKAGKIDAFGALYDRYAPKIYRFVYYKTFSKEVAEDLTSDVFTKALEKIDSYETSRGTFSAWLYRIARNTVIDYYRTRHPTLPINDTFDLHSHDRTPETHDAILLLKHVEKYLTTLTPRQREIITLRIWEEKSYREIAEIVGGSEDSVKMAFLRSIRDVREKCGPLATILLLSILRMQMLPFTDFS